MQFGKMTQAKSQATKSHDGEQPTSVPIDKLRADLRRYEASEKLESDISKAVSAAEATLFGNDSVKYADAHVKSTIEALLLSFISLRESNTHGKQLMEDFDEQFGTKIDHGRVYRALHKLLESGRLERCELVQTKAYSLDDTETVRADIEAAANQHFAFGLVFQAALEWGDFE